MVDLQGFSGLAEKAVKLKQKNDDLFKDVDKPKVEAKSVAAFREELSTTKQRTLNTIANLTRSKKRTNFVESELLT